MDDSPFVRWQEASLTYQSRPVAEMSKDDFMIAITAALMKHDPIYGRETPDILAARDLAHACVDNGFLLSPIEKLYLSVVVMPMIENTQNRHDTELLFHEQLWDEARTRLKRNQFSIGADIALSIAALMIGQEKFTACWLLLTKSIYLLEESRDDLRYYSLRQELSIAWHPSRTGRLPPPAPETT